MPTESPQPYEARGFQTVSEPEVEGELAHFLRRLRELGASPDEIEEFKSRWDQFDDDWTEESRREFVRLPDGDLRAALAQVRAEYDHGTLTEDEERLRDLRAAIDELGPDAHEHSGHNVDGFLEWVGDSDARAAAAVAVEHARDKPRRGVIDALTDMLGEETVLDLLGIESGE